MERADILARVDHTLLAQTATWADIRKLLDETIQYGAASACLPPSYVREAVAYVDGRAKICTVIGFPNGYMTEATKLYETQNMLDMGADEIDMVINLGWLKDGMYSEIEREITAIKRVTGEKILKVIIETCLLTEDEKIRMCAVVSQSGADYIKTSTGFSTGGATLADIELMRKYSARHVKVKAAGGIKDFTDAENFINAGADRLGTSRLIKLMQ